MPFGKTQNINMSYYTDYIQELCPYSEEWVVEQICGEIDRRDNDLAYEKRNAEVERLSGQAVIAMFEEYKNAMEWGMGSGWTERILKQYRENKIT